MTVIVAEFIVAITRNLVLSCRLHNHPLINLESLVTQFSEFIIFIC